MLGRIVCLFIFMAAAIVSAQPLAGSSGASGVYYIPPSKSVEYTNGSSIVVSLDSAGHASFSGSITSTVGSIVTPQAIYVVAASGGASLGTISNTSPGTIIPFQSSSPSTNTVMNTISSSSVSNDSVTLPAGVYEIYFLVVAMTTASSGTCQLQFTIGGNVAYIAPQCYGASTGYDPYYPCILYTVYTLSSSNTFSAYVYNPNSGTSDVAIFQFMKIVRIK